MQNSRMDDTDVTMATAIESLANRHYAVIPGFLSPDLLAALREESQSLHDAGKFHAAGIGRGAAQRQMTTVRSDSICWLEPELPAGGQYLALMERWRCALNESLFLGLRSFETHYARYEPGSFYCKHIDRHRDNDARIISVVCYLNDEWPGDAGGELQLFNPADELLMSLPPYGGTLTLFTSDNMPHEVLPANRPRLSLAGWFRRD